MIFETHAHYDDASFDNDRDLLMQNLLSDKISAILNVGASIESTKRTIALAEKYDAVYAAVGVHPGEIGEWKEESLHWLREQARHPKVVAIGEIGLDYHWEQDPAARQKQRQCFAQQMELAKERRLPVIIHSRDAAEDTMQIMKSVHADEIPGVVHCYSYSPELAAEFLKMGYYIGVGGVVTFKNAKKLKEVVRQVPLEKILLETDAPYMAPEPFRGKRNDSSLLVYVAEAIAELRGISKEEVERVTMENACRLFLPQTVKEVS